MNRDRVIHFGAKPSQQSSHEVIVFQGSGRILIHLIGLGVGKEYMGRYPVSIHSTNMAANQALLLNLLHFERMLHI